MEIKKILLGVGLSTLVVGVAAGIVIGVSEKYQKDPNLQYYEEGKKDLGFKKDGIIQIFRKGEEGVEEKIQRIKQTIGEELETMEYLASNKETYVIVFSPRLKEEVGKEIDFLEIQIHRENLIKENLERPIEERAETIKQIKDLFGESNVVYQKVSGNPYTKENVMEEYTDEQGRIFYFDVDKNKILSLQIGGENWCKTRQDILDENCRYKEGKITEKEARENVLTLLTKTIGEAKAKEVIENCEVQRATEKGNTFIFIYPATGEKTPKDYQILVAVEPVKGEIINYQNWLP
ncbi:MAG: hypothetical protein ACKKMR_00585 [Candidatus Nealsonbacteria bacterium]